jgi:hypothetical protein
MEVEVITTERVFTIHLTEEELAIITNWGGESSRHYKLFSKLSDLCIKHGVDRYKVEQCE